MLGAASVFPAWVFWLVLHPVEGPFGRGFEILYVSAGGATAALLLGVIGAWRRRRGAPAQVWFLGAAVALSPAAYFLLWNAFWR